MKILITGGSGQVGHELMRTLAPLGTIVAPTSRELDLRSPDGIRETMQRVEPDLVVNAAAYTAVDAAEREPELCATLNAEAPRVFADAAREQGACFVHFSTDYVFDGTKGTPYVETDEPRPMSVYGRTKLEGERAVASVGGAFLIFRTSWVYGARGKNFPRTMLRLAAERSELSVVDDQIGAPTSAPAIASAVARILRTLGNSHKPVISSAAKDLLSRAPKTDLRAAFEDAAGIYHLTAAGSTTWYEFARTILDGRSPVTLRPITTAEYPTAARRPAYSVLDNARLASRFGVALAAWDEEWRSIAESVTPG